jgi:uncharacterized FAD-dependent dehydrogenase
MLITIDDIRLFPDRTEEIIPQLVKDKYGIKITSFHILKKSLDARNKNDIYWRYRILIDIDESETAGVLNYYEEVKVYAEPELPQMHKASIKEKVVIVGAGPAGLFCALRLIEAGMEVSIFERGKPVEQRMRDIEALESDGVLNPESNVLFGEGGAGTYSDGKLTTRINRPEIDWFYKKLIENGAPESAAYESKPHIGTDRLRDIIKNIREKIIASGGEFRFSEKVTGLLISGNKVYGVVTSHNKEYKADYVVLTPGHSARDLYEMLHENKITLEKKGFAVGSRIEHPAELIRSIQYGKSRYANILPAAEYSLTWNNKKTGRGIYSFCMCPGGAVINSSSEENLLCTNGMSMSDRGTPLSNAAIVVTVTKEDTGSDIFGGIDLQRNIERMAFRAGGGGYKAPAQSVLSFIKKKTDKELPPVSYRNGVEPSKLEEFLPQWISSEIRTALEYFDKRMNGFVSGSGIFIGAETRTSSPLRILRGADYQSVSVNRLYPAGEGAGYAGGIVSSAVDGIKCADAIIISSYK